ncbi:tyrosine-protein kinase JAK2-like isoform X2 [Gigantopelta aegis]|nr:tyrosine-protein kinase JAK2-like isoform X2 [Gigantopelta aegis]XP_041370952.1 tyrosine-protein kinase JAK2-like isoform X2 [Gigantopelta aegis]XP_041370959.1 tyrosine-protein kinase JAK2-like isoform X2 [Gigantopelta aegis]
MQTSVNRSYSHMESPGLKIHFYGNTEPIIIPETTFPIVVEDVCVLAAKHLSQKLSSTCSWSRSCVSDNLEGESLLPSFFLSTFGLVNKEHRLWLSPRERLTVNCRNYHEEYHFRVRFRICDSNLDAMARADGRMMDYFYCQCRDDFLNDRLSGLYNRKLELEKQLGLVVLELMILEKKKENQKNGQIDRKAMTSDCVCRSSIMSNITLVNLWQHLSKGMRRKFRAPWHYIRIYLSLRSEVQQFFQDKTTIDVKKLKKLYVKGVLEYVPNYATETYKAKFVKEDGVTGKLEELLVDAYESLPRGISSVVHTIVQFDRLQNISLTTSGLDKSGGQVHIDQSGGQPKMLLFETKEEAESFVSGVDGFFRHQQDFYNGLCKIVEPPSLELLRSLRSFGPMTDEQASEKLQTELTANENEHGSSKSSLFLIHQTATDLRAFVVLSGCKGKTPDQFEKRYILHKTGRFCLKSADGASDETYENETRLLKELRVDSKQIRPQSGTDSGICVMFTDDVISHYYPVDSRQIDKQSREPMCFTDQHICPADVQHLGFGRYTEVSRACLDDKKSCNEQDVIIKQLKKDSSIYMEAFQESMSKLLEMRHSLFIHFLGNMIAPPYRVVLELAPGGNLERLLKQTEHPLSLMQIMLVADQVSQGIHWLRDKSLTHGNLRSRNILVFKVIRSDISIKIGDPGLVSHFNNMPLTHNYNQERLPWIAVELYSDLRRQTIASDIYAFAMLWWELLSHGQRPLADIKPKSPQKLQDLISAGTRPSCPKGLHFKSRDCSGCPAKNVTQTEGAAQSETCPVNGDKNQPNVNSSQRKSLDEQHDSSGIGMGDNSDDSLEAIKTQIWQFMQKCWTTNVTDRPDIQEIARFVLSMCDEVRQIDEDETTDWDAVLRLNVQPDDANPSQRAQCPITYEFIDFNRLRPVENAFLGKGFYGEVTKYKLYETSPSAACGGNSADVTDASYKIVAVKKMLKMDKQTKMEFLKEITVLQKLAHENIVKLEGICFRPDTLLVMEFVECGSLKDFVKSRQSLDNEQIGHLCRDVAKGIQYLHSKEVVHRDLAARNILITKDMTAKITDFGLAVILREGKDYTRGNNQNLPVHLCAPEALSVLKFTKKGDVWSFGVLMWEAFTRGDKPILVNEKMEIIREKLFSALTNNRRLPQKNLIPTAAYNIMKVCWTLDANNRPDINSVLDKIEGMLSEWINVKTND